MAYLSRGLFKLRLIFARINGPNIGKIKLHGEVSFCAVKRPDAFLPLLFIKIHANLPYFESRYLHVIN